MTPFLGMNVGLSLNCHIPPSVLLANARFEPRFWAGHALDVVEGLTVRMQRVHVEKLKSFRSSVISQVASSLASLQVMEEGGLGERLPDNTTGTLEKTVSCPPLEALNRSRSALGLSPPVVVDDGLDAHEQVAGRADCLDNARIFETWYEGGLQFVCVPF